MLSTRGIVGALAVVAAAAVLLVVMRDESRTRTEAPAPIETATVSSGVAGRRLMPVAAPGADVGPRPELGRAPPPLPDDALHGLGVRAATQDELRAQGVSEKAEGGVVVTEVDARSPAAEARLEAGDLIIVANKKNVKSEDELREIVGDREQTLITVYRGGKAFQVVLHRPWKERYIPRPFEELDSGTAP